METKTPGGVTGKGFLPGHSGNPGGRPKGLAQRVRRATHDGKTIVDFMTSVARGAKIDGRKPRLADRMDANKWLADRGWGRAIQGVEQGFDGGQFRDRVTIVIPDNGRDPRPPPVALPDGDTVDMDNGENGG
ncbi:MAG: hypothetical protein V3V07_04035 [candidate division NC10 bacterium]